MKSLARLVLFFTTCFILIFFCTGGIKLLQLSVEAAKAIPALSRPSLPEFISAIQELFPLTFYCTLLLALSYAVRRKIPFFLTFITLLVLAGLFSFGSIWSLLHAKNLKSPQVIGFPGLSYPPKTLGSKGLILPHGDTVTVILGDPNDRESPRVISRPGYPLVYQGKSAVSVAAALPQAPFKEEDTWLTNGIFSDLSHTVDQLESRFRSGLLSLSLYEGALILLLLSLRFVMQLSSWPMANLFSGAVAFRGVLAFETFIDSGEVQSYLGTFIGPRVPSFLISPIVFGAAGVIIIIYTLLIYSIKRKSPAKRALRTRNSKRRRG
jgi:hypothetical protein